MSLARKSDIYRCGNGKWKKRGTIKKGSFTGARETAPERHQGLGAMGSRGRKKNAKKEKEGKVQWVDGITNRWFHPYFEGEGASAIESGASSTGRGEGTKNREAGNDKRNGEQRGKAEKSEASPKGDPHHQGGQVEGRKQGTTK